MPRLPALAGRLTPQAVTDAAGSMSGLISRAPRRDEADAIADALNAHSQAVHGTDDVTGEEIRFWFEAPDIDPEADMRIAVPAEGTVAAYADLSGGHGDPPRFWIDVRARPGCEAAIPQLLRALESRARERAAGRRALLRVTSFGPDVATAAILAQEGMRVVRSTFGMVVSLDGELPEPVWPSGVTTRAFGRAESDERVYAAHQDGFADHWDFHPEPIEEWRHALRRPPFDLALWFLAEAGSELAGLCLCRPEEPGRPDLGWVNVLTVRRRWRRQGLARALLLHAFTVFRERGKLEAGLAVDAENTTGAVSLYESVGMRVVRRNDTYEKPL